MISQPITTHPAPTLARFEEDLAANSIERVVVLDRYKRPHLIRDFYADNHYAILIFLRNFLDYTAVEYCADLAKVPKSLLKYHNTRIVPIGCAGAKFIREFEELSGLAPIFTDPERILYTNLNLRKGIDYLSNPPTTSPHVKSNMVSGVLSGSLRAMKSAGYQGDPDQMGGALIFSPTGEILFFHRDKSPFDHARINTLLNCVGIPEVDF